jgi:hypothetical protein
MIISSQIFLLLFMGLLIVFLNLKLLRINLKNLKIKITKYIFIDKNLKAIFNNCSYSYNKMTKPILVTGGHRFGTTWVGRILSASEDLIYIGEPFNVEKSISFGINLPYWFTYINNENEKLYYESIKKIIRLQPNLSEELRKSISLNYSQKIIKNYLRFTIARFIGLTPLIKDPIALFSAEWLANNFDMNVVIIIRHPAAFISSLKNLNWNFPFNHLLEQPLLMKDHLVVFKEEIIKYSKKRKDIIDQGILLWEIFAYIINKYKNNNKKWIFLKHEDLSRDPLNSYFKLYKDLGLNFNSKIVKFINRCSSSANPIDAKNPYYLKRDSKLSTYKWKKRLNKYEIERIREKVEYISCHFYRNNEW